MFKGVLDSGDAFSVEFGMISMEDKAMQNSIQMAINLRYDEYSASVVFMDNHIGRCIVRDYGGRVISEDKVKKPVPSEQDDNVIY